MRYSDLIERLEDRGLFRIKPGLGRMRRLGRALGDPQDRTPSIHIAGTNGKGSVASGLESVLRSAGYRTGLYTSPHLVDARERIQVQGRPISAAQFKSLSERILRAERRVRTRATYFEFMTLVAFLAFAEEGVQVAVVECGLGGLWDATNALRRPLASVVTTIGLDHERWLGRSPEDIALQKAGIFKAGVPGVSGVRGPAAAVIAAQARAHRAPLVQLGRDFHAVRIRSHWTERLQEIEYRGGSHRPPQRYLVGLLGAHQVDNAALVIQTVELLRKGGLSVPEAALEQGLERVRWPGRFHLALRPEGSPLLFDGAHNPQAMHRFLQTLQESNFRNAPKTFIFSAFQDKDYRTMAKMIEPMAESVYVCPLGGARGASAQELRDAFRSDRLSVQICRSPAHALQEATYQSPRDGVIIITGSLALVGRLIKPWLPDAMRNPGHRKERIHV